MSERYLIAGPLRLDLRDERLSMDGAPVRLGGRALSLMTALMEQPQILLTKDELFARVWPGLAVSDAVLTTAVKELRQGIGDSARKPRFIETAHGRGYRFLLPVIQSAVPADSVPAEIPTSKPRSLRPHWPLAVAIAGVVLLISATAWLVGSRPESSRSPARAVAAVEAKSIVVLPFEDFSSDGDQQWFADGLAEEIQTTLARAPDLRLVSRTSAARLSREGGTGQQVAAQLGAAQFLEGSVRRSGDRVRVTAKLVRAADGLELWSQSYDRDVSDVISIQEDIAFQIASALKTVMDPARLRVMVAAGTRSVEAYEAYLEGRSFDQRQLQEGDQAFAVGAGDAYERARTLDPNFSAAHWRAAQTWFGNATRVDARMREEVPEPVRLARYLERVDAAIATSRDDTESLKYRAGRASMELQFRNAHRLMARYLAARPRDIDAWEDMADLSAYAGERAWMRRSAERIHALSLEEGNPRSRAITVSVMALDLDAATARAREQLALRPDQALTQYQAHRAFIWSGRVGEARALLPRIQASRMPETSRLLAALRQACAENRLSDAAAVRAEIDRIGALNNRWQAAQIVGDTAVATELLRPLDAPEHLSTLMQYRINPTFEARSYPVLSSRLTQNGIALQAAVETPSGCRAVP